MVKKVFKIIFVCIVIAYFTLYLTTIVDTLKNNKIEGNKTNITTEDIVTDYYEDDMTVEITVTNNSKIDAERVEVVYYVYNDKDDVAYMVSDIFSLDAGESKYIDLSFCDDYSHTEIKVFDVY